MALYTWDKAALRRLCREIPHPGAAADAAICARVMATEAFARARVILAFYPTKSEPDIRPLLRAVLTSGRTLLLPRTQGGGQMRALRVRSLGELERRAPYGLYEPPESAGECTAELAIVPGVAFDEDGYRLGRGGGYYDRYLAGFSGGTIGVCHDARVLECVPRQAHDRPVQWIATPSRTIVTGT